MCYSESCYVIFYSLVNPSGPLRLYIKLVYFGIFVSHLDVCQTEYENENLDRGHWPVILRDSFLLIPVIVQSTKIAHVIYSNRDTGDKNIKRKSKLLISETVCAMILSMKEWSKWTK